MSIGSPDSTVGVEDHPASAEPVRDSAVPHGKSPTRIAMDRLRKDKVAVACAGIVLFFILIAIFAPLLTRIEGRDIGTFHPELVDEYGFPTIIANSRALVRRRAEGRSRQVRPLGLRRPAVADRRVHRHGRLGPSSAS